MHTKTILTMLVATIMAAPAVAATNFHVSHGIYVGTDNVDDLESQARLLLGEEDQDGDGVMDIDDPTPHGVVDISRSDQTLEGLMFQIFIDVPEQATELEYTLTSPAGKAMTLTITTPDNYPCLWETLRYTVGQGITYNDDRGFTAAAEGDILNEPSDGTWHLQKPEGQSGVGLWMETSDGSVQTEVSGMDAGYVTGARVSESWPEYGHFFAEIPEDQDLDEDGVADIVDALPLNPNEW